MSLPLKLNPKPSFSKPDTHAALTVLLTVPGDRIRVEYIIKILGLQRCADTVVGNAMVRGVSGGEKKRVTTGEILVGGARVLLMDEISTGAAARASRAASCTILHRYRVATCAMPDQKCTLESSKPPSLAFSRPRLTTAGIT